MRGNLETQDEYGILTAIWILASNDETSMMTFRGIRQRLNLSPDFDVEDLVHRHGELFRRGVPASRLDEWKTDMRAGRHMPSWIREATGAQRTKLIDDLKPENGFRSQFRADRGAPKSNVAVIEWGLNHIERMRKAQSEAREATAKSWQMWLVLAASLLGVAATIIAAILKR